MEEQFRILGLPPKVPSWPRRLQTSYTQWEATPYTFAYLLSACFMGNNPTRDNSQLGFVALEAAF